MWARHGRSPLWLWVRAPGFNPSETADRALAARHGREECIEVHDGWGAGGTWLAVRVPEGCELDGVVTGMTRQVLRALCAEIPTNRMIVQWHQDSSTRQRRTPGDRRDTPRLARSHHCSRSTRARPAGCRDRARQAGLLRDSGPASLSPRRRRRNRGESGGRRHHEAASPTPPGDSLPVLEPAATG